MGDEQQGHAAILLLVEEQFEDLLSRAAVQIARGLVRDQDRWVEKESARDGHPLLFSARKL